MTPYHFCATVEDLTEEGLIITTQRDGPNGHQPHMKVIRLTVDGYSLVMRELACLLFAGRIPAKVSSDPGQ